MEIGYPGPHSRRLESARRVDCGRCFDLWRQCGSRNVSQKVEHDVGWQVRIQLLPRSHEALHDTQVEAHFRLI